MGRAAWRVAALGCLGVACIESVPVQAIDGAQSGLLILEDRDRRRVIAFEGRTNVPIGPEVTRAAMLSLACPLATYGIPETELELFGTGTTIEGEHRLLPEPLEVEGLDVLGVESLPLEEMVDDRLAVRPPWQELPPVVDKDGQIIKGGPFIGGGMIAFGDQLLGSRTLFSPFGSKLPSWDAILVGGITVVARATAPRGPNRQPRIVVLVETSSTTREIWLVELLGDQWAKVETVAAPTAVQGPHYLFASWQGPKPRYLIADQGALHWTRNDHAWESLSTSGTWLYFLVGGMGAAWTNTGWWLSNSGRTFNASPGKLEEVPLRFVAGSQDGGRWELDQTGRWRRRTADGRPLPIDGPRTEIKRVETYDGALLARADGEVLFWPAEACARPWRWPLIGGLDEVNGMGLTDAYVVRNATGFTANGYYTEWRARPDRTPTDELE
ncbi:MAG: hypothetical protein IPG45_19200 [Deltaproteobacteria bacterium]|nr:hypothetical protein [Deltaproteobacteria bacterium]